MNNSKKAVQALVLTVFFIPFLTFALPAGPEKQSYTPRVDSLLNIIDTASTKEKLRVYQHLHSALYEVGDIDIHLKFNRRFTEEAKEAKDKVLEALAYTFRIELLYNYRAADSIMLAECLSALDIMRDVPGAEVYYSYTTGFLVDIYMLAGNYEEALKVAERVYEDARKSNNTSAIVGSLQSMGKVYGELEILDKAVAAFRESIEVANEDIDYGLKAASYAFLADMLNDLGRSEEALEVCMEHEAFLERIGALEGDLILLCYQSYTSTLINLGRYDTAREYLLRVEDHPLSSTGLGIYEVEKLRYLLAFEEGKYAEAERSLDILEQILEGETSSYQAGLRLKQSRADLYHQWGLYEKAADCYKEYIVHKDSLQVVEMAEKLNSLRTRYEVDKLEMQKEQQRRSFRSTVAWLAVVMALLCGIIAVAVFYATRLRAKNRSLLDRIKEQDKLERDNEQLRNELALQDINTPGEGEESDKMGELYLRLKELMKDPAVFTDADINRKTIALKLGTNEKYVFDIIRQYYDMNIQSYITNLRLNYARNMLAMPSEKRTIESIGFEAGFNSRATFHRLFRERYGMTPSEFRRLVAGS